MDRHFWFSGHRSMIYAHRPVSHLELIIGGSEWSRQTNSSYHPIHFLKRSNFSRIDDSVTPGQCDGNRDGYLFHYGEDPFQKCNGPSMPTTRTQNPVETDFKRFFKEHFKTFEADFKRFFLLIVFQYNPCSSIKRWSRDTMLVLQRVFRTKM